MAGYHWGSWWWKQPVDHRPAFAMAKLSCLLKPLTLLEKADGSLLGVCLGNAKWGGMYLRLERVRDIAEETNINVPLN